jgi:RimJ/RimL family protein N-acetyltransferase
MTTLTTRRLVMRPPAKTDANALVRGLGNFNVSRWTGRVPHPYGPGDAEAFIAQSLATAEGTLNLMITLNGEVVGGIGIDGELGYWLAEPWWGRGLATEAARAVTDHAFISLGFVELKASYQLGNDASRRILLGLGFTEAGVGTGFSKARQTETQLMGMGLGRGAWQEQRERRR